MNNEETIQKKFIDLPLPHSFMNNEEVCNFLNETYNKSTNSRKRIEKILDQFSVWHKDKRKYVVTDVHGKPKDKVDGRSNNKGGNNKKYADDIDDLILFVLYMNHSIDVTLTFFKEEFKLISNSYYDDFAFNARSVAESFKGYPVWYAYDFFVNTRLMASSMIKKSLKRLSDNGLIEVNQRTFIQDTDYNYRVANRSQLEFIETTKKKILSDMGFKKEYNCIKGGKYDIYKNKLSEALLDKDIIMVFDKFEITQIMSEEFYDSVIISDLEHFHKKIKSLNDDICENILKNAQNRKNKSLEKINKSIINFIREHSKGDDWRVNNRYSYIDFYIEMIERYIRIK